jgi:hypothetical protein
MAAFLLSALLQADAAAHMAAARTIVLDFFILLTLRSPVIIANTPTFTPLLGTRARWVVNKLWYLNLYGGARQCAYRTSARV